MARKVQATVDEYPSLWWIMCVHIPLIRVRVDTQTVVFPQPSLYLHILLVNGISLDAYVSMGLARAVRGMPLTLPHYCESEP